MGTTDEIFQLEGGRQHLIEELNNLVTEGAITSAVAFNMRAKIPSDPLAFGASSDLSETYLVFSAKYLR